MRFLSVCSGIEAASVAWNPLGWKAVAFSEIEPFPCSVLQHHYPDVPNLGDMTAYESWPDATLDLLCGGTPCQSFSVAGLRKGLDDPRGNLMLTFGAIAARYRPRWLVWENVPGVLSSNGGRDFGAFLGLLGHLGYGFAYRVLDAQYFGVAQRRRRVFVVGCLGDWRRAAAVLLERHGLQGNPAPSREAGQATARCLTRGSGGGQRYDGESETFVTHALTGEGFDASEDGTGRGTPLVPVAFPAFMSGTQHAAERDVSPSLGALNHTAIAFQERGREGGRVVEVMGDVHPALTTGAGGGSTQLRNVMTPAMKARRLTPRECERLQGFPDDYTLISHRGKVAADGPRYKALGNSWAVPCVRWIGLRLAQVDAISPSPVRMPCQSQHAAA